MKIRVILITLFVMLAVVVIYIFRWSPYDPASSESDVILADLNAILPPETKSRTSVVKIRVFYEVLCPDSKHFIVRQLYPAWAKLKSMNLTHLVHIELIPYGKASSRIKSGKYSFDCQHGEEECRLNRIHSCVLADKSLDFSKQLDMVKCSISRPAYTEECGLHICTNADELLYRNGQITSTDLGVMSFVPTITVDGSQRNQIELLKNFYGEIIQHLKDH